MATVVPVTVHTDGEVLLMVTANPPALTELRLMFDAPAVMSGNDGMTTVGTAGVIVNVGVKVLVGVLVGVCVDVLVGVYVGVCVAVCVAVYVGVLVLVAVSVGVSVGVCVCVYVGVAVGVCVLVAVCIGVSVIVGVIVAVGARFVIVCTTPSSLNEPSQVGSAKFQFVDAPSSPGAPSWNMAYSPVSLVTSYRYETGMVNPPRLLDAKIPPS
jgi:hypothetical protein